MQDFLTKKFNIQNMVREIRQWVELLQQFSVDAEVSSIDRVPAFYKASLIMHNLFPNNVNGQVRIVNQSRGATEETPCEVLIPFRIDTEIELQYNNGCFSISGNDASNRYTFDADETRIVPPSA